MTIRPRWFASVLGLAAAMGPGRTSGGLSVPRKSGPTEEQTCGQEMAASAEVPRSWQALMNHVASNMEWHATWVGFGSTTAKREHDALLNVAKEYRAMAAAAGNAAAAMSAMKGLAVAVHDPSKVDRAAQARWMRAKIQMQRDFASLLIRHAEDSEKELERRGGG